MGAVDERLDHAAICRHLAAIDQKRPSSSSIEIFPELASTNAYLSQRVATGGLSNGAVCLAEQQSAGRGRRGRVWVSPAGGLYLSLYWAFALPPQALSGLGLVVAVVAAETLRASGLASIQLKWPNDLVVNESKLGGILIELTRISENMQAAVIGLGVNQCAPESSRSPLEMAQLEQPWTGWEAWQDPAQPISRNTLAARLIAGLRAACDAFATHGLAPWVSRWEALHRDQLSTVRVELEAETLEGVAMGLDPLGGLRVVSNGGQERVVYSGDVARLRPCEVAA